MLENMKEDKRTDNKLEESLTFPFLRTEQVLDLSEQQHGAVLSSFEFSEWSFRQALGYTTLWILIYRMSNFNSLYNPICISDRVNDES